MDANSIIALVSVVVSGLVSGLALYLSYRERTSSYRNALYNRQLDGFTEIIQVTGSLNDLISMLVGGNFRVAKTDEQRIEVLQTSLNQRLDTFYEKLRKWSIFLPPSVHEKISDYIDIIYELGFYDLHVREVLWPTRPMFEEKRQLRKAYSDIVEACRDCLVLQRHLAGHEVHYLRTKETYIHGGRQARDQASGPECGLACIS